MPSRIVKVSVRVPATKKDELLALANSWRSENFEHDPRGPGWDAKAIHDIARLHYGGLREMFAFHGWPETGSQMMRQVQKRVKQSYGSVETFNERHKHNPSENTTAR
ncbi:MAG: hypothetical protein AB7S46_15035 [Flavobacteriaceae bacterium]